MHPENPKTFHYYGNYQVIEKKFILHRQDKIINPRNPAVAVVSEDPLGEAFELKPYTYPNYVALY